MRAGLGVDQLDIHADLVASASHAALKHITHTEVMADLLRVGGFAFVCEGGIAGDYETARDPRQIGSQIVDDPVCEIFLVWIVRQVAERQDDDRQTRRRLYV